MEIDKSLLPAESLGWRGLLTLMERSGIAAFIFSIWTATVFDGWYAVGLWICVGFSFSSLHVATVSEFQN